MGVSHRDQRRKLLGSDGGEGNCDRTDARQNCLGVGPSWHRDNLIISGVATLERVAQLGPLNLVIDDRQDDVHSPIMPSWPPHGPNRDHAERVGSAFGITPYLLAIVGTCPKR